jgi:putative peptidoglycan lipid II flippase
MSNLKTFLASARRRRWRPSPLLRDTAVATIANNVGKGLGLAVPFFIADWFTSSSATDAFFFAYAWVTFVTLIFAPVLESVVVPFIAQQRSAGSDVGQFVGRLLPLAGISLALCSLAGWGLISALLPLITNFPAGQIPLVKLCLVELTPLVALTALSSLIAGTLNAYRSFALPGLSAGIRAVIVILSGWFLKDSLGIQAISLGYIAGEFVRLLILFAALARFPHIRLRWEGNLFGGMGEFVRKAGQQTLGMVASELSPIVDKMMATALGVGAISALSYAERLYLIPIIFSSSGFLTTFLSHWSHGYYGEEGGAGFRRSLSRSLRWTAILAVVAGALLILLHRPLVFLAYGRPGFPTAELKKVALLYALMNLALLPQLLSYILTRAFLTVKNTRAIRNLGIIRLAGKIALNLLLIKLWGLPGIAVATALAAWIGLFYLFRVYRRGVGYDRKEKK